MTPEDKHKYDRMVNRQRYIIHTYCNSIGCKDCPLREDDDSGNIECESSRLNTAMMDLEMK
jgi:DNA invertase Pin-like site-specific DNA recombinase